MPVRNQGFELVLKDFPVNQVEELMRFHLKNGGLSRYVKFRHFFENIRGEEITTKEVEKWANRFSGIMKENLLEPNLLIEDSLNFVKSNHDKYEMHIVSGSDQQELQYLCYELNINPYFKNICGSPTPKIELVKTLLKENNYNPKECLLIGDSFNDFEAADSNEVQFFGYNNPDLKKLHTGYIESFNKL